MTLRNHIRNYLNHVRNYTRIYIKITMNEALILRKLFISRMVLLKEYGILASIKAMVKPVRKNRRLGLLPFIRILERRKRKHNKKYQVNKKENISECNNTIDVIICIHNALDDVKRCLESVINNITRATRLILIDDGSDKETQQYVKDFAHLHSAVLIRNDNALGYTKAANRGLELSKAEFVILLNSDTIVSSKWLERLVQCANSDTDIGIVGPLSNTASWQSVPYVQNESGDWADNALPDGWTVEQYANEVSTISRQIYPRVGFINGFCFLIRREVISDTGVFDEIIFSSGYGEENDYCLRAADNGWDLAVADDCYVYHAQSKSYSHERRTRLVELSGQALMDKHGLPKILEGLAITQSHQALVYMRKRCESIQHLYEIKSRIAEKYHGRKVLFFLPARTAGGGSNIVLLEAEKMRSLGVDAWIANLEEDKDIFEKHHPDNTVPAIYFKSLQDVEAAVDGFDAIIATLFLSVYWMHWIHRLIEKDDGPVIAYYVQDFEPDFFEPDSEFYKLAWDSYTQFSRLKLFTKTYWNLNALKERRNVSASIIGPSFNIDLFYPPAIQHNNKSGPIAILAMVRPISPRRAPLTTMKILKRLSEKFGDNIQISIFGVDSEDPDFLSYPHDFNYQSLGLLDIAGMRSALAGTDIFLDSSVYQAMGLTAMEALASGATVVGPIDGGMQEFVTDMYNGLLVDTRDENAIEEAMCKLILDRELLERLKGNSMDILKYSPILSVHRTLNVLFDDVQPCNSGL